MSQFALPFGRPPAARRFVIGAANDRAVRMLERWPTWPVAAALLTGPRKSGRSLLARTFAAQAGARVIDDAERAEETQLFHAWNEAQAARRPLLIVADQSPPAWTIRLPDLRSRLLATPLLAVGDPDETMMRQLLDLHFERLALPAPPNLVRWLARRLERTHLAAMLAVERIDAEQSASRARLSIPAARATLLASGMLAPDHEPEAQTES